MMRRMRCTMPSIAICGSAGVGMISCDVNFPLTSASAMVIWPGRISDADDDAVVIEAERGGTASARQTPGRPFEHPRFRDQFFDDQRDGAPLQPGEPRQIGPREGLPGANEVQYEAAVDLARYLARCAREPALAAWWTYCFRRNHDSEPASRCQSGIPVIAGVDFHIVDGRRLRAVRACLRCGSRRRAAARRRRLRAAWRTPSPSRARGQSVVRGPLFDHLPADRQPEARNAVVLIEVLHAERVPARARRRSGSSRAQLAAAHSTALPPEAASHGVTAFAA